MDARILIVDDDANLRETLRDILEMEGCRVSEAGSGQEAMKHVVTGFFDVILMDFSLADKTGIEVIQEIRKLNQESPVIMITGHASLDTAVKAIKESVYDFLIKPVDYDNLKRTIGNALASLRLKQENRRLIEQLKSANEKLWGLNNMKSKFLSMASHDLSNALMTLQASFDLLKASLKPDAGQSKKMNYITAGLSQIARLIEDLVDWASIEKGRFGLETNFFNLPGLVQDITASARQRASQKGIEVKAQVDEGLSTICADKKRLTQVLLNLVDNAVRHTPRGGSIRIAAAKRPFAEINDPRSAGGAKGSPEAVTEKQDLQEVELSVEDTGDGIEPRDLSQVFESFYQAGSGQQGRLGLGLSIAREIIASHGGRIWVESDGPGKGAAFRFTLPLGVSS